MGYRRQPRRGGRRRAQLRVRRALTCAQTKDYWPNADEQGEYGHKLNDLTKFVASSKLDGAAWGDFPAATVTRGPAATIRMLKEHSGKDV